MADTHYKRRRSHFHLVAETPQPNGRYKSLIADGSGSGYLRTVCEYLNPARAKLLRPEQAFREYRWSSWPM